jgi:hypothetical protein
VSPLKPVGLGLVVSDKGLTGLPQGDSLAIYILEKLRIEKAGNIKLIVLGTWALCFKDA